KARYTVQVFDPRGRMLHKADVELSELGSFRTHFLLPPGSVQGTYRVVTTDASPKVESPRAYQGEFVVHEYQLEPVRLAVEADRSVFYRGEFVEGKITAKFYYGAPVAGREIRYQWADGSTTSALTDANGEVKFKLATREFREAQVLPLTVMLPERNLGMVHNFFLATQGFSIQVSTVRPVYLSGESFEVNVKTIDAQSKPSGQKLALKVLERTTVDGRVGERLVKEMPVATDAKDGTARQTVSLEAGGKYVLRVEGIDRFNNPVSGAAEVLLSDEKDAVRLRILADKHTFKAGESAKVNLHWRERPALALVAYQGARVLKYQLIELKTGENQLELPMAAAFAPNFELAVAVMVDPAKPQAAKPQPGAAKVAKEATPFSPLHMASSPFTVSRDLDVKLEVRRKGGAPGVAKPGEEVEVVVVTTDPQGKPVAAELSLALVEQSLLDRFASSLPAIGEFFGGGRREMAVRTTASITFAYRPASQTINPRLLAEEDRKAIEAAEAAKLAAGVAVDGKVLAGELGADSASEDLRRFAILGKSAPADPTGVPLGAPAAANELLVEAAEAEIEDVTKDAEKTGAGVNAGPKLRRSGAAGGGGRAVRSKSAKESARGR
ncbi:MAG: hypothetical protein WD176_10410, partial [Pirellulales bacterium]